MKPVEIMQVIRTNIASRGDGTENKPMRLVTQYWSMDGELLFTIDPMDDPFSNVHIKELVG